MFIRVAFAGALCALVLAATSPAALPVLSLELSIPAFIGIAALVLRVFGQGTSQAEPQWKVTGLSIDRRSCGHMFGLFAIVFASQATALDRLSLPTLDGRSGFRINGERDDDLLGSGVDGIGDFNADGVDDFLLTAEAAPGGGALRGSVYLIYGKAGGFPATLDLATIDTTSGVRFDGTRDYGGQQINAIGAGDLNGDGKMDVAIGLPELGYGAGRVCVVFGRRNAPATFEFQNVNGATGFCVTGQGLYDNFGRDLGRLGDFNGDGIDDLAIGAFLADNAGTDSGSTYVLFGRTGSWSASYDAAVFNGSAGFRIDGAAPDDRLGLAHAGGDLNNDGRSDLLIGNEEAGAQGFGGAYVVFGSSGPHPAARSISGLIDGVLGFELQGEESFGWFGRRVDAGDVNADGVADLIGGALFGGTGGYGYVLHGRTGVHAPSVSLAAIDGANGFRIDGSASFDRLGEGVAYAGDLNGDGIGDAAFGAPYADPSGAASGTVYVVFGTNAVRSRVASAAGLRARSGFKLDGGATQSYCGIWLAAAGDVNDDGLDDLALGCHYAPGGGSHRGEAYVVYGNRAPMVRATAAPIDTAEDAVPVVVSIADLARDHYLDAQPVAGVGITATPAASVLGRWEYRAAPSGAFAPIPNALGAIDALVLGPDAELRYVSGVNAHGSSPGLALRFWDGAGTAVPGPAVDISDDIGSFGGFAEDPDILNVVASVQPVNDAPSFTAANPPPSLQDGGLVEIAAWAIASKGPPNESGQSITAFEVVAVGTPSLFADTPTVAVVGATGTLRYRAAPAAYGTSTFDVRVRDDGGTERGGFDASPLQTFTITVSRPNPIFTDGYE